MSQGAREGTGEGAELPGGTRTQAQSPVLELKGASRSEDTPHTTF